jgi:hypothetical protein
MRAADAEDRRHALRAASGVTDALGALSEVGLPSYFDHRQNSEGGGELIRTPCPPPEERDDGGQHHEPSEGAARPTGSTGQPSCHHSGTGKGADEEGQENGYRKNPWL